MSGLSYGVACCFDAVSDRDPITLRGDIEYLAETLKGIGYEGIELQIRDPQQYDWARLRAVADGAGLKYTALATGREFAENGLCLISDDAAVRRRAIDKLKLHVDMAQALDCFMIIGRIRGNIPDFSRYDHYLGYLTEATLEICDYAATKNVVVPIENILASTSNYLNTMRQVTDFVTGFGRSNLVVHLDTYSMLMEDNDIAGSVEYCADKLAYVHFSDSARLYPGGGNVDFKAFVKALKKIDYRGFVVVECVPVPDAETCARYSYTYMKAMEDIVAIETAMVR